MNLLRFLWAAAAAIALSATATAAAVRTPDFAYPKTVQTEARGRLDAALKAGDDQAALRAIIDIYLARVTADPDAFQSAIEQADSTSAMLRSPSARALGTLFTAEAYNRTYMADRWRLDRRELPLTPLPASVGEWSGAQMRAKVMALISEALSDPSALGQTPLQAYADVIEQNAQTRIYTPTLLHFALGRAIAMLEQWTSQPHLFRAEWIGSQMPVRLPGDPVGRDILDYYDRLASISPEGSAPNVAAQTGRTVFMCSNTIDAGPHLLADKLMELYKRNEHTEWAGDILASIPAPSPSDPQAAALCADIERFMAAYPAYWRMDCLRNTLSAIRRPGVSVKSPTVVAPGSEVTFKIEVRNVSSLTLRVYDVSSAPVSRQDYVMETGQKMPQAVAAIPVSITGKSVPFSAEATVSYTFPKAGAYIVVPEFKGQEKSRKTSYPKTYSTCVALAVSNLGETRVWTIDPMTGTPLGSTELFISKDSYRTGSIPVRFGTTNAEGWAKLSSGFGNITAVRGADRYAWPMYANAQGRTDNGEEKWHTRIQGFASLPVYHPGDTIEWSAVAYEYRGNDKRTIAEGTKVRAVFCEPSGTPVDTIEAAADRWGRIEGRFATSRETVTGNYAVILGDHDGYLSVTVSDYKLPTYLISGLKALQGVPEAGGVTIAGTLESYSGFPMEGASVSVSLAVSERPRWWFSSRSFNFYSTDTVAGEGGRFEIPLSAEVLGSAPIAGGYFTATVTALSQTGESRTATISFTPSEQYAIRLSLQPSAEVNDGKLRIETKVTDQNDSTVRRSLAWTLSRPGKRVDSGSIASGKASIDVAGLPSGEYSLGLALEGADSTLAAAVKQSVTLYRTTDKDTPLPRTLLWSPQTSLSLPASGKGEWLYATDMPTHLLVTISADGKILSQKWHSVTAGMGHLEVELPEGCADAAMDVSATAGYRTANLSVTLTRGKDEGLRITTQTFRDKLKPGAEEEWVLRVTDLDGRGREAAVMARLYNAALEAIASNPWRLSTYGGYVPGWNWRRPLLGDSISSRLEGAGGQMAECPEEPQAMFNTYGLGLSADLRFYAASNMYIRGTGTMGASNMRLSATSRKMEFAVTEDAVAEETAADMAAPMDADAGAAAAENGETAGEDTNSFSYRPSETALAFFRPSLATDPDGTLRLRFTLPEANTTWNFTAMAWTEDLLSDMIETRAVASKAVMVQPNLPRFVREGDMAVIPSMVMNATDSAMTATVTTELFNPADGSVTYSRDTTVTIPANSSATSAITMRVPRTGASLVGYRIKAVSGENSDGEQTLLPVLEATNRVVETHPFYLDPDSGRVSLAIPVLPEGGANTLQYCGNPVWYVVTALPGLIDREAFTAPEAARAIFAAAIAEGILRDNPDIAETLRRWTESDRSAETLTSMLSRNDELKMMLLQSTPWMSDAKDDTERMTRLSLLFDKKLTSGIIKRNIALLGRLEASGGGWAWNQRYPEYSAWASHSVLSLAGRLCELGFLPENAKLSSMLRDALARDTKDAKAEYRKYPKSDFTSYVMLHDRFRKAGYGKPDAAITSVTCNRLSAGWRKLDVTEKAVAAVILSRNGYPRVAAQVMESLTQNVTPIAGRGACFKQIPAWNAVAGNAAILDAFLRVMPGSPVARQLAQWLTMEKSAQDWGSSAATSDVVATILAATGKQMPKAGTTRVMAGETPIVPASVEETLGEFAAPIPSEAWGKTLTIEREGKTPAYGAIISQYTDAMSALKAASCPELAIEKRYLIVGADGKTSDLGPEAQLAVGDRLRVTLTITCTQTMDYVAIRDERAACLEPADQLPGTIAADGLVFYRENGDASTRIFINRLPAGTYILSYDMWVNNAGEYAAGTAQIQSQYAPRFAAHSAGGILTAK